MCLNKSKHISSYSNAIACRLCHANFLCWKTHVCQLLAKQLEDPSKRLFPKEHTQVAFDTSSWASNTHVDIKIKLLVITLSGKKKMLYWQNIRLICNCSKLKVLYWMKYCTSSTRTFCLSTDLSTAHPLL